MSSRPQLRGASFARFLMWGAALGSALVGVLGLMGWAWDVPLLKAVVPDLPALAPNTTLGLILGGLALGLLHPYSPGRVRRALGMACTVGLALLGALDLLQRFILPGLGFQELLFRWTDWSARTPPALTAPSTAACMVLLAGALLVLGRRAPTPAWWMDTPVILELLIALFTFNGNIHGAIKPMDKPLGFFSEGMGLHTSAALLLLGAGILCARPGQGLMGQLTRDTLGGFLARWLVPMTLLGPSLLGAILELLYQEAVFSLPVKAALFSTTISMGGAAMVLLCAHALNRIDAEREQYLDGLRAARAEADRERTLLQAVVEHAPVGILFVDLLTDAVRVNSALQGILGIPLDPHGGRQQYVRHLRHPDGQPVSVEELPSTRALAGQEVPPEKYCVIRTETKFPILVSASPVREPSGEVRGAIVCVQDISAHEELERLREEYVGLISHDLRTPLQNISLRCQQLLRSLEEKHLATEVAATEALLRNARRMNGMVEELLEGSRLEAGQVTLHREPLDMIHFIEEIIDRDVPPDVRERLRLEVASSVPWVLADAPRLERVLVNLLTNALKYSAPGTPVVVRLEREATRVKVSVRDQGKGLTPEETQRLFTKYYRARGGRRQDGVGLGLYISRLIIEAHGGHIHAESTPGKGSTFSFTLPLTEPAGAREPGGMPSGGGRAPPQSS